MTLLSDIQFAQASLLLPFANKPVLIRTPLTVAQSFNSTKQLWLYDPTHYDTNDTNDYVYLRLFPEYTAEDEYLGDRLYKNSFSRSATASVVNVRKGFSATVRQSAKWIYDIVERISTISNSTSYGIHNPIKIVDFCRTESQDSIDIRGEQATIRWGKINVEKAPSFIRAINGKDYCKESWDFKFFESRLRNS